MYFTLVNILQINAVDISKDLIQNIAFINYQEKIHQWTQLFYPIYWFFGGKKKMASDFNALMSYSPLYN